MSGPKTSRYTLTPEQMRIMREQMERERRTNEEQAKLKRCISELMTLCANLTEPLEKAKELQKRTGEGKSYIETAVALQHQVNDIIQNNSQTSKQAGVERLESQRKTVETCLKSAKDQIKVLAERAESIEHELQDDINKNIDKGFTVSFADIAVVSQKSKLQVLKESLTDRLNSLYKNMSLPQTFLRQIEEAKQKIQGIENDDFLENYKAMTVAPLEKKCRQYIEDYEANSEYFYELLSRYHALCEMSGVEEKEHTFSQQVISDLKDIIAGMEKQLVEQQEQIYISQCIDEVMTEMGYDLLGDRTVTKRSGKRFHNELYSFGEGTAVNVTYASDGKITMELGGVDSKDRLPTEDETHRLCEDMQSFCKDFSEIEKKLKAKGVIAYERISILPHNSEYAQIINTQDYNIKGQVEEFNVKRENRKDKKYNYLRKE